MPTPLGEATCAMCPKMCRFTCPTARASRSEAVHPTGLASTAMAARRGTLPWDAAGKTVYACTMCLGCNTPCALDQDVPQWLRFARRDAIRAGAAPQAVYGMRDSLIDTGSCLGVKAGPLARVSEDPDVVFFPSCETLASVPEATQAAVAVLESAGLSVSVLDAGCCGGLPADLGLEDEALRCRTTVVHELRSTGAADVVTDGDVCAATLGAVPFSSYAAELIAGGRVTPRRRGEAAIHHDPCILSRGLGATRGSRAVAAAVYGEVTEPVHSGPHTRCCGAGAGLPWTHPGLAAAVGAERAAELGAGTVVTPTPRCGAALRAAGAEAVHLSVVLAEAL